MGIPGSVHALGVRVRHCRSSLDAPGGSPGERRLIPPPIDGQPAVCCVGLVPRRRMCDHEVAPARSPGPPWTGSPAAPPRAEPGRARIRDRHGIARPDLLDEQREHPTTGVMALPYRVMDAVVAYRGAGLRCKLTYADAVASLPGVPDSAPLVS